MTAQTHSNLKSGTDKYIVWNQFYYDILLKGLKFDFIFAVILLGKFFACVHSGMFWKFFSPCTSSKTKLSLILKTDNITNSTRDMDIYMDTGDYRR